MLCKLSQSEAQSLEIVKVNKVYIEVLSFKSGKFNGWINQNWGNGQKMKFLCFFGILTSLKAYVQLSIKLYNGHGLIYKVDKFKDRSPFFEQLAEAANCQIDITGI